MEIYILLTYLCILLELSLTFLNGILYVSASQCTNSEHFRDNFIMTNATFFLEKNIGLRKCAEFCLEFIICESLSYSKRNLECRLNYVNGASYPSFSSTDANFIYGVRADVKNLVESACSNNACAVNERCVQLKSKTTVCIPYYINDSRPVSNVAFNKLTEQSSNMNNKFISSNAVDDVWLSNIFQESCSETKSQLQPWWRVDLSMPYLIHKIQILNRSDCCSNRLSKFGILIGILSDSLTQFAYREQAVGSGATYEHSFRYPILGRYVKIMLYKTGILHLCEFAIHANN